MSSESCRGPATARTREPVVADFTVGVTGVVVVGVAGAEAESVGGTAKSNRRRTASPRLGLDALIGVMGMIGDPKSAILI